MLQAIHDSAFAVQIRESQLIYPLLQVAHIIGLSLFAGGTIFANLRVADVGRNVPLVPFVRYCTGIAAAGLVILVPAGLTMYTGFVDVFFVSGVMRIKLAVLVLALVNFALLWRAAHGQPARWDDSPPDPVASRKWVALGIALFLTLVTLGKLLAYIGGKD